MQAGDGLHQLSLVRQGDAAQVVVDVHHEQQGESAKAKQGDERAARDVAWFGTDGAFDDDQRPRGDAEATNQRGMPLNKFQRLHCCHPFSCCSSR